VREEEYEAVSLIDDDQRRADIEGKRLTESEVTFVVSSRRGRSNGFGSRSVNNRSSSRE
jgi:hypothetical protein